MDAWSGGLCGAVVALLLVAGCADDGSSSDEPPAAGPSTEASAALWGQLDALDDAVARWETADDLASAHAAAEEARNLVVGPAGPGYGDTDGDGTVGGEPLDRGLLPGLDGQQGAATVDDWLCLDADVLGGSWGDPGQRWAELEAATEAWSPTNNPFPGLASHPQRIVGWATLTLATDSLEEAVELGGHARLHVDVTVAAAEECVPGR